MAPSLYGTSSAPAATAEGVRPPWLGPAARAPIARMAGTSVAMPRRRATRPPSWSTLTMIGPAAPAPISNSSVLSATTCSSDAMLRLNKMAPPTPASVNSERALSGTVWPSKPRMNS